MPSSVVDSKEDEEKWKKAKEQAKKQGKGDDYEYIMGIYKKMNPDGIEKESSFHSPLLKRAQEFEDPEGDEEIDPELWSKAEKIAEEEGHGDNEEYIMEVYQSLESDEKTAGFLPRTFVDNS